MKLDRNINPNGRGKYALLLQRRLANASYQTQCDVNMLRSAGLLDFGATPDTEFFVIRLKDKYAAPALAAYAMAAYRDDLEYSMEVMALAVKAAEHPNQRKPD